MPGGEIDLKINGELHRTLKRGFQYFKYCLPAHQYNTKNDIFQLESSNGFGISKVLVNGKQVLVGKIKDQSRFEQNRCRNRVMISSRITIQNDRVISTECQGIFFKISSLIDVCES